MFRPANESDYYTDPSSARFCRQPPPQQACGLSLNQPQKLSHSKHYNLFIYYCFQISSNNKRKYIFFLSIFFLSQLLLLILVHKICWKYWKQIYKEIRTPDGLAIKTKMKYGTKLTIEIWSQKLNRLAIIGLGMRHKLVTNSFFWYFLLIQGQIKQL